MTREILLLFICTTRAYSSTLADFSNNTTENAAITLTREKRLHLPLFPINKEYLHPNTPVEETYDFIIVGSGSAGSVLANRLSENQKWKILLLEVGDEAIPLTDIPVLAPVFQFSKIDWNYKAEKQDGACLGCPDQRMHWPRGRALGGTTVLNYMIHVRGNPLDYDRWAAMGNPGWSYKDVLPYFIKMEDADIEVQDKEYHQKGGYLSVGDIPHRSESAHAFVKAAQEAGHPYVDYNGKDQMGVSYVQGNLRRGKRCSGEKAYLRPARDRNNLKVSLNSRAIKILINPGTSSAYGIKYVKNRRYYKALVTKEVILSAGAFNSPQLLMLSGIGPKEHLEELNIPVVQNLPVGQKMYDHITFVGLNFITNTTIVNRQSDLYNPVNYLDLIANGKGPLTTLGGVEALAYIKTNASTDPDSYPDMELIFIGGSVATDRGLAYKNTLSIKQELYDGYWKDLEDKSVWQVIPMLVHPKSVGYLRLKSKNPYHWPKFYPNYFTDAENHDIKTFVASIREIQRINEMPSFQKYGSLQYDKVLPGCERHTFDTDEYWECALRHITPTLHHQVSTCKMGPSNDPEAVVDNKLKVYGIKNLRVADTSVIPLPLTAHTNIPAYMVGEKASDLIKMEWEASNLIDSGDIKRSHISKKQ
ncbi:glucose dehydrogenase [FAD, quinone]-like [Cylas formicarius]|uniref:glucose dehydrogenase [FAD, quinone]-like n=1 Tax=Cylas formicarius TaxID=197179 RepID=UPI002958B006|nr:glucose dehydrogenase [FAD, quinone]-like [Cylas formicarius]